MFDKIEGNNMEVNNEVIESSVYGFGDSEVNNFDSVIYKVNRHRKARNARYNSTIAVTSLVAIACLGLGFAPELGLGSGSLSMMLLANKGIDDIIQVMRHRAVTYKLKRVAKMMRRIPELSNFSLGKPDYENGTINFVMNNSGYDVPVTSSNMYSGHLKILNDLLDKAFRNDCRDVQNPENYRQFCLGSFPKVTIENLAAAYAPVGGLKPFNVSFDKLSDQSENRGLHR